MKKYFLFFIFFTTIYGLYSENNIETIKLDNLINILKKESNELILSKIYVEISENKVYQTKSMFDVMINNYIAGTGKKNYSELSSTKIDYTGGFETGFNFTSTLPSGTQILLGSEYEQLYSWGNIKPPSGTIEDFNSVTYDPTIKIKISQPFIYNYFGFLDRYAKKDATNSLNIEKLKYNVAEKNLVCQYTLKYYQWISYKLILEKLKLVIENSSELEKQTLRKMKSKLLDEDDYQKSVYSVIKYRTLYNNYLSEYDNITNEIKTALKIENNIEPDINELDFKYNEFLNLEIAKGDFSETITGQIVSLTKKNLDYQKDIFYNKTLPKLNLTGTMDVKFRNYYNDSSLVSDANSYGDIDFIVGLDFSYPLGNFKAKGDYENVKLLSEKLSAEEKIMSENYDKIINKTLILNSYLRENLELKKLALDSLYLRLKTENIKFNNANIEIRNLIETENLILSDEIELLNLKLVFIKNYIDYFNIIK